MNAGEFRIFRVCSVDEAITIKLASRSKQGYTISTPFQMERNANIAAPLSTSSFTAQS